MSFKTLRPFSRDSHQARIILMETHTHSFADLTAAYGEMPHEELLVKQIFMYLDAPYWEPLQVWGLAYCHLDASANCCFAISCVFKYVFQAALVLWSWRQPKISSKIHGCADLEWRCLKICFEHWKTRYQEFVVGAGLEIFPQRCLEQLMHYLNAYTIETFNHKPFFSPSFAALLSKAD